MNDTTIERPLLLKEGERQCDECGGDGWLEGDHDALHDCQYCGDKGYVTEDDNRSVDLRPWATPQEVWAHLEYLRRIFSITISASNSGAKTGHQSKN
jgi:hypothetical protein